MKSRQGMKTGVAAGTLIIVSTICAGRREGMSGARWMGIMCWLVLRRA